MLVASGDRAPLRVAILCNEVIYRARMGTETIRKNLPHLSPSWGGGQSNMIQTVTQVIKIGNFKTFTDLQK